MGKCAYSGEPIDLDRLNTNTYDIDHIYPRSKTKDDSITRNLVLVKAELNREKTNMYPVSEDIRKNMGNVWASWYRNGLIAREKYERLTRSTPLTDDELAGFIARQLVETSQSTKAICDLLRKSLDPKKTKIVMVKAGEVSDLRHVYGYEKKDYNGNVVRRAYPQMIKIRELNDFHHAKDAYLNIVVGNVINETFTDNPYHWVKDKTDAGQDYSIRTELLFRNSEEYIKSNGETSRYPIVRAWDYGSSLNTVLNTMKRNDVLWTRMNHRLSTKGGCLMDTMLVRKADGYIPRKKDARLSDTSKYGGYNSAKGAHFSLIENAKGERRIVTIPLLEEGNINKYLRETYSDCRVIIERIDYMSKIIINKYPTHLAGRHSESMLSLYPASQLVIGVDVVGRIKRICNVVSKMGQNKNYIIQERDGVFAEDCMLVLATLVNKMKLSCRRPGFSNDIEKITNPKSLEKFKELSLESQCKAVYEMLNIMGCNAIHGNLSFYLEKATAMGRVICSNNVNTYDDIKLVYQSPTGLYEKVIDLKTVQPGEV